MQQDFYKDLLDNLYDGVYFVDSSRTITYWNKGAERISGFQPPEVVGRACADNLLMHVDDDGTQLCVNRCPLAKTLEDGETREAEVYLHHKGGHRVPVNIRITPMRDESGRITGAVEIFTDKSSRREMLHELNELKQMAMIDPLTGLGNRRAAAMDFERKIKALRNFHVPFGLLFVDLDAFKTINDTFGHEIGDQVLVMVAKTLVGALRGVDKVYRWGGEEFLALVPGVDAAKFRIIAERMRRLVEASALPLSGDMLRVTVSVGGCLALESDTLETALKRADDMMYRSKNAGRNCTSLDCS
ncbi:MAG: sensor domain-containing diguanylate cyclase [Deltaproteobacteria bacterium HGW-Deltaproteobacteria-8]|jgi:diguanylate cyclase (GGDEF)-like protein/PAS domain S-box-containing protein|nr:MAG: sensor domain-containing diguanylate cyclase [Deltaproteobacteria bacterium HGW-Deltaproteobacteria-8]